MAREPRTADWEHVIGRDLMPHLLSERQAHAVYRPADVAWLPDGAHAALVEAIGPVALEDMLVVPAVAWPIGWRRRCLYSPRSVMGIGERGVAQWVQALPSPGVLARVLFGEIIAVSQQGNRSRRVLVVTGQEARLLVRYDPAGQDAVDAWARQLRLHAAALGRNCRVIYRP